MKNHPSEIEIAAISAALNYYFDNQSKKHVKDTSSNKNYLTPWQIGALDTIDVGSQRKILGWAGKQIL
ncbi:MAG: hypothetical protein CL882_00175 [Dehalococcoidia bacterium]|nr:hypothetical protein [Dehalococcoidia bacterium]